MYFFFQHDIERTLTWNNWFSCFNELDMRQMLDLVVSMCPTLEILCFIFWLCGFLFQLFVDVDRSWQLDVLSSSVSASA